MLNRYGLKFSLHRCEGSFRVARILEIHLSLIFIFVCSKLTVACKYMLLIGGTVGARVHKKKKHHFVSHTVFLFPSRIHPTVQGRAGASISCRDNSFASAATYSNKPRACQDDPIYGDPAADAITADAIIHNVMYDSRIICSHTQRYLIYHYIRLHCH